MTKDENLDLYLLIPCRDNGKESFSHSVQGWFEVENKPLRLNTVCFIGSPRKLKNQLKRKEGIELVGSEKKYYENFKGMSGLTFQLCRPDGSQFVMIWMPKFDWSIIDIETLSHECLHASVMIMRMSGVRSKIFTANKEIDVDDEGLCYRHATMMTSIIKKMVEKQNKMFKKGIGRK